MSESWLEGESNDYYRSHYTSQAKKYLDMGHISKDQYDEYVKGIDNNEYFWKNENGEWEGKDMPNPNKLDLASEGYEIDIIGPQQALQEYVKDEIVKLKVAELEEVIEEIIVIDIPEVTEEELEEFTEEELEEYEDAKEEAIEVYVQELATEEVVEVLEEVNDIGVQN